MFPLGVALEVCNPGSPASSLQALTRDLGGGRRRQGSGGTVGAVAAGQ